MVAATTGPGPLRVGVLCRHTVIRAGLVCLLQTHPERATVVPAPEPGRDLDTTGLDVLVCDLRCAFTDETSTLPTTPVPVVALFRDDRDDLQGRARAAGVRHFVGEEVDAAALLAALTRAAGRRESLQESRAQVLSKRELEVMSLIGAGLSNREIAEELVLSINTIKTQLRHAYRKANVANRQQAVLWAIRHHLVPDV